MAVKGLLSVALRHSGRDAIIVSNLKAVRAPEDDEVSFRRHVPQPTGSDPGPGAAGIDEDLDIGHLRTVPGALSEFGHDIDLYARSPMTQRAGRQVGSVT